MAIVLVSAAAPLDEGAEALRMLPLPVDTMLRCAHGSAICLSCVPIASMYSACEIRLGEGFGREEHLERVGLTALVEVDQPVPQSVEQDPYSWR